MDGRLQDRVAVITGGGSGIGAATARLFAAQGARLALVDRDEDAADAMAEGSAFLDEQQRLTQPP